MGFFGAKAQLTYDMFDIDRSADEAKRAVKLRSLYHKGQDLAWDGQEVLSSLVKKHGGVTVHATQREALGRVFDLILWGELAAWRISAALADRITELEPKMAATSQAHDEARHFYVMYDYLAEMGYRPQPLPRISQRLLEKVILAKPLAHKLLGMQLQVETMALTLFQAVRENKIEPVLTELLRYFEKDEARHVGLGIQYLPSLIGSMNPAQGLRLLVFQLRVTAWSLGSLKAMEPHLRVLGIPPLKIFELGRAKQLVAFIKLWEQMGIEGIPLSRELILRTISSISRAMFLDPDEQTTLKALGKALSEGWNTDLLRAAQSTTLDPNGDSPA